MGCQRGLGPIATTNSGSLTAIVEQLVR